MKLKHENITEYKLIGISENFNQKERTAKTGLVAVKTGVVLPIAFGTAVRL
jgi:hypothetical protein